MKKFAKFLFYLNFAALDLFALFILYKLDSFSTSQNIFTDSERQIPTDDSSTLTVSNQCGEECREYIDTKLGELLPSPLPTSVPSPQVTKTVNKQRSVLYIPIIGSGSTNDSSNWVNLAGTDFYLNKGDFPGFLEAYFEATIKLVNGNGQAMVRIWDATHSIAVSGSEVKTASQTSIVVISEKLNFWAGNNLYKIQAKSLTADTTVFESGRIRIVSEN